MNVKHQRMSKIVFRTFSVMLLNMTLFGETLFLYSEKSEPYISDTVRITYDTLGFFNKEVPVFFHSGEIQYFRVPEDKWEDVILKAKNGLKL